MAKRKYKEAHLNMSEALNEFIEVNKLQKGIDKVDVKDAWRKLMGTGVWNYTTQVELRHNVLYIGLTSAVLRAELSYGKTKIIKMINEELGKEIVKKLILA